MSRRPIVNTGGPGLANSAAVRFSMIALVVGIVVLLIFAGLAANSRANGRDVNQQMAPGSSMGAPAPQAT